MAQSRAIVAEPPLGGCSTLHTPQSTLGRTSAPPVMAPGATGRRTAALAAIEHALARLVWHAMVRGSVTEARQLLTTVLRSRIEFMPMTGTDGRPMYKLPIPIAFDRLLVSVVPGLEGRLSPVGLASLTIPNWNPIASFLQSMRQPAIPRDSPHDAHKNSA